jgi:hypothetical protein
VITLVSLVAMLLRLPQITKSDEEPQNRDELCALKRSCYLQRGSTFSAGFPVSVHAPQRYFLLQKL